MISNRDAELLCKHPLVYAGKGPTDGAWRAPFLLCPRCFELMSKDQSGACHCGAIEVDRDAFRITVQGIAEETVRCFALGGK